MNDDIVAGVMPLHIEQAQARAEAVQTYISKHYRNGAERDRLAAALGISPAAFLLLVQAWKSGKGVDGLGRYSLSRKPQKPRRAAEITNEVIALKGAAATLKDVREAVLARCAKEQVKPPCPAAIHKRLMKARARTQPQGGTPSIVIGDVLINLACQAPDGSVDRLRLAVAVEVATKQILAYRIAAGEADIDMAGLLRELRQVDEVLPILIDEAHRHILEDADAARTSCVPHRDIKKRMTVVFGSGFPGFPFVHQRRSVGSLDILLKMQKERTVELETAIQALEAAIKRHNGEVAKSNPDQAA